MENELPPFPELGNKGHKSWKFSFSRSFRNSKYAAPTPVSNELQIKETDATIRLNQELKVDSGTTKAEKKIDGSVSRKHFIRNWFTDSSRSRRQKTVCDLESSEIIPTDQVAATTNNTKQVDLASQQHAIIIPDFVDDAETANIPFSEMGYDTQTVDDNKFYPGNYCIDENTTNDMIYYDDDDEDLSLLEEHLNQTLTKSYPGAQELCDPMSLLSERLSRVSSDGLINDQKYDEKVIYGSRVLDIIQEVPEEEEDDDEDDDDEEENWEYDEQRQLELHLESFNIDNDDDSLASKANSGELNQGYEADMSDHSIASDDSVADFIPSNLLETFKNDYDDTFERDYAIDLELESDDTALTSVPASPIKPRQDVISFPEDSCESTNSVRGIEFIPAKAVDETIKSSTAEAQEESATLNTTIATSIQLEREPTMETDIAQLVSPGIITSFAWVPPTTSEYSLLTSDPISPALKEQNLRSRLSIANSQTSNEEDIDEDSFSVKALDRTITEFIQQAKSDKLHVSDIPVKNTSHDQSQSTTESIPENSQNTPEIKSITAVKGMSYQVPKMGYQSSEELQKSIFEMNAFNKQLRAPKPISYWQTFRDYYFNRPIEECDSVVAKSTNDNDINDDQMTKNADTQSFDLPNSCSTFPKTVKDYRAVCSPAHPIAGATKYYRAKLNASFYE